MIHTFSVVYSQLLLLCLSFIIIQKTAVDTAKHNNTQLTHTHTHQLNRLKQKHPKFFIFFHVIPGDPNSNDTIDEYNLNIHKQHWEAIQGKPKKTNNNTNTDTRHIHSGEQTQPSF